MQAVVGSAAVSEVVFNAALKYLLIRLASGSRRHLEAIAPDMQRLRPLQKGGDPVFGVIVTTAAGGVRSGSAPCCASCAIVRISRLAGLGGTRTRTITPGRIHTPATADVSDVNLCRTSLRRGRREA